MLSLLYCDISNVIPRYITDKMQITESRHLKAYVTMAGMDLLCVGGGKEAQEVLKRMEREATFSYQTLTLPEDYAANVLCINGTLVHRSIDEIPQSFKVSSHEKYRSEYSYLCNFLLT